MPARRLVLAACAAGSLVASPAVADPTPSQTALAPGTEPLGSATIVGPIEVRSLHLDDGRVLRLAGIDVAGADQPPGPSRRPAGAALCVGAVAALSAMVLGKTVELRSAGNPTDRHGRVVAHVVVDGQWVEAELLKRGLARVHSVADNRAGVPEMLAIEDAARRGGVGIWADRAYAVRPADDAGRYAGSFQIVDGTIVKTGSADGQVYLDFGADWHSAFSAHLTAEVRRLCQAAGLDPRKLDGKHVRVRGFIDGTNHPVIDVTHPEQIELL
jgi:endonuclease YncB( thermonuclease family)